MANNETNRVVDRMFRDLEAKGLRAIAYSNDERVRTELLAMMQTLSNYKIEIHKAIATMEADQSNVDKVLLDDESDITDDVLAQLGPKIQIIKKEKDDEST